MRKKRAEHYWAWPLRELNSAIAREIDGQQKILPIIAGDKSSILQKLPLLADKLYLEWDGNPDGIASRIAELKTDFESVM